MSDDFWFYENLFRYSLYAVVQHLDITKKSRKKKNKQEEKEGHYVTYIRQTFDRWFFINDGVVEQITFEEVSKVTP